jgi:nitrogen fixation NifU-like protein
VAKFPARVKCALLSWMAWKDAATQIVASQPGKTRPVELVETTKELS